MTNETNRLINNFSCHLSSPLPQASTIFHQRKDVVCVIKPSYQISYPQIYCEVKYNFGIIRQTGGEIANFVVSSVTLKFEPPCRTLTSTGICYAILSHKNGSVEFVTLHKRINASSKIKNYKVQVLNQHKTHYTTKYYE